MNFIKQIERIKKIHLLIQIEKTGTPDAFAKKLNLSRRQLYNELEFFKDLDASIKYCKKRESFYYDKPFNLELKYSLKTIIEDETKEIFGGFHFRASLLHGTILSLY
jgi:transcriptional antiterminator